MDIDSQDVQYSVQVWGEAGQKYNLDSATTGLQWEEQEGQLAQKATISFASDATIKKTSILSILKLNRRVIIYANWGKGKQVIFQGIIWEWNYQHGKQRTLSITAYDPMVRLQQTKDHKYFSAGMNTKAIIGKICTDEGVPLDYKWPFSITHQKKVFRSNTVSDMIIELLEEVRKQKNSKYVTLYRDGKLEINAYGTNKDMYKFGNSDTISTSDKLSMDKLVTRVKILGKADDEGRSSVEAVINGNLEYGVLQEIITRDSDKELGEAKQEANTLLADNGKPEETLMATGPDVPFLRKGDAVEMKAGNINGICYVLGVSHNAFTKQMTMTLLRQAGQTASNTGNASGGNSSSGKGGSSDSKGSDAEKETETFKKGDSVILNGPVYADSYGKGKGRTFTDYKSTITLIAALTRPCPYRVGQVGWVYPNEITKA